jgi:hypothetical protein
MDFFVNRRQELMFAMHENTHNPDGRDLNEGYLSWNEPQIIIS